MDSRGHAGVRLDEFGIPGYIPPEQVDQRAAVADAPDLPQPSTDSPPGRLQARLFVNRLGEVDNIEMEESTLPAAYADLLRPALLRLRFTPAQVAGQAVPSWVRMEFVYEDQPAP